MKEDIYIRFLREYYAINKTINNIPYGYTVEFEGQMLRIYDFIKNIKNRHRAYLGEGKKMNGCSSKTSIMRYQALEEMDIDWKIKPVKKGADVQNEEMIRYLRHHYEVHKTINNIPYGTEVLFEGKILKIGSYLRTIRERHAKYASGSTEDFCTSEISLARYKILDEMNFDWEPHKNIPKKKKENETCLKYLKEYYEKYGSIANISQKAVVEYEGQKLEIGKFLEETRVAYRKYLAGNRTDSCADNVMIERYDALTEMNFIWEPNKHKSNKKNNSDPSLEYLKWYYKEHGTINDISSDMVVEFNGITLHIGEFLSKMRYSYKQYKKGNTSRRYDTEVLLRRYQILEELEIDWNPSRKRQSIRQIALANGISESSLLRYNKKFNGDLDKALKFTLLKKKSSNGKEKKKKENPKLDNVLETFDIDYDTLTNYLKRDSLKTGTKKEEILRYKGMTLREFCLQNGYNYDVIKNAVKLKSSGLCDEDLESLINRCVVEYKVKGQNSPSTWIYSKYGNEVLVKHMILFLGFDSGTILHNMSSNAISLEEAISKESFNRTSKDKYNYLEPLYMDFISFYNIVNNSDEYNEKTATDAIADYTYSLVDEYHLTKEEYDVIITAFTEYTTAIHKYHLFDVAFEKDETKKLEKIINYRFNEDDIEESFFIPLNFDGRALIGRDSELYNRRVLLKNLSLSWNDFDEDTKASKIIGYHINDQELYFISSSRKKIDEIKTKVFTKK